VQDLLDLADYRRRVGDLYRLSGPDAVQRWRAGRDDLFRTHPQSPIEDRESFRGLDYFDPDPGYRVTARMEEPGGEELLIDTGGEDGAIRYRRAGRLRFALAGQECSLLVLSLLAYGGGLWLHLLHDGEYSQLYPMRSLAHGLHDATLALPIIGVAVALGLLGAARLAGRPGAGLPGWLAAAASACGVAFAASVAFGVLAPLHDLLLDGELLAFKDGVVRPFFELQHRLGRKVVSAELLTEVPVIFVAFDLLYLDGRNLLTEPLRERRRMLDDLSLPSPFMLAYLIRALDAVELDRIFEGARARNNEGLMVKDPESRYTPGRRGLGWLKLKKALATLDVVVTGVEVGHGKRKNVLSDYTFAVYDEAADRLVNIGKAYSGLTDVEIAQMTDYFKSITLKDYGRFRLVQPEIVLEVAFDAIMESGRHNSGYALRFPRIKQIRRDKTVREIDTLANVARMHRAFTGDRVQLVEPAQA